MFSALRQQIKQFSFKQLSFKQVYPVLKKHSFRIITTVCVYVLLIEFVFVFLFPFLSMIMNSLKFDVDIRDINREWIISKINIFNYKESIKQMNYWKGLQNNLLVSGISSVGHVLSCSLVAYGLARFKFPGRNLIFGLTILTIIVPSQLLLIPLYIQYANYKWLGSFLPIVAPTFFGMGLKSGLYIFIFRQFVKNIPVSYEEAAKIEGCGYFRIFSRIIIPLSKTGILVIVILSTIWHWNDYFEPAIFLKGANTLLSQRLETINMWHMITDGAGRIINPVMLAGCVLNIVPLLIIYFIFQKQFMQGVEMSGLAN